MLDAIKTGLQRLMRELRDFVVSPLRGLLATSYVGIVQSRDLSKLAQWV